MKPRNYPPAQMNLGESAYYCGVSVGKFRKSYRSHLKEREDGGNVYFLKQDLDKLLIKLFKDDATWEEEKSGYQDLTAIHTQAIGSSINESQENAFTKALERRSMKKQNAGQSSGSGMLKKQQSTENQHASL